MRQVYIHVVSLILFSLTHCGCHSGSPRTISPILPCLPLRPEHTEPPIALSSNIPIVSDRVFWATDVQSNSADLQWSRQPTTPEVFRLSETNVFASESAAFGGDAQAAFRLANHYGFAIHDWTLYLRWCAITAELGGPTEAATSLATFKQTGAHPDAVVRAFDLSASEVEQLKKNVQHSHDAKAAFRLALFFGYSINDAKQRDKWLWTAVTMGSTGAKICVESWHTSR